MEIALNITLLLSGAAVVTGVVFGLISHQESTWPVSLFMTGLIMLTICIFVYIVWECSKEASAKREEATSIIYELNLPEEKEEILLKAID